MLFIVNVHDRFLSSEKIKNGIDFFLFGFLYIRSKYQMNSDMLIKIFSQPSRGKVSSLFREYFYIRRAYKTFY